MVPQGKVVSLHIHPEKGGEQMISAQEIDLEAGMGVRQDLRYFARSAKRQVTLIEREQIAEHAGVLGLPDFECGVVRSNIETEGIELVKLQGERVRIGTAVLMIGAPRDPCEKMDRIAPGLRDLMDHGKQGVLAQVLKSGKVRVGDSLEVES